MQIAILCTCWIIQICWLTIFLAHTFLIQQECYIVQKLCIKCFRHNKEETNMNLKQNLVFLHLENYIDSFVSQIVIGRDKSLWWRNPTTRLPSKEDTPPLASLWTRRPKLDFHSSFFFHGLFPRCINRKGGGLAIQYTRSRLGKAIKRI